MDVSCVGGGNRSTRRKPPTCRKSLTTFITLCRCLKERLNVRMTIYYRNYIRLPGVFCIYSLDKCNAFYSTKDRFLNWNWIKCPPLSWFRFRAYDVCSSSRNKHLDWWEDHAWYNHICIPFVASLLLLLIFVKGEITTITNCGTGNMVVEGKCIKEWSIFVKDMIHVLITFYYWNLPQ